MRRWISSLLLVLMLAGCVGDSVGDTDISTADVVDVLLAWGKIGDVEVFDLHTTEERYQLTDDMLELLYGDLPSGASDGTIALSKSALGGEVHVLRASSLSERRRLERLLAVRASLIEERQNFFFVPESDEVRLKAAVEVEGLYVMLLVTSDNASAVKAARELLK